MKLINKNDDQALLMRNEKIKNVITSKFGNVAVQTSANRYY